MPFTASKSPYFFTRLLTFIIALLNVKRLKDLSEFLGVNDEGIYEEVIPTQSKKTLAEIEKLSPD